MDTNSQPHRLGLEDWSNPEVLIIGGGINGAGVFRDLVFQGVRTLLVTKGDFSEGATSAASRMIHGGLRYLEQAEFRLVRESLAERNHLLVHSPHYVKPLKTTIPIFSWTGGLVEALLKALRLGCRTGRRGALWVKLGLSFYDHYVRHQRLLPRHFFTSRMQAKKRLPQLAPGIVCTASYYDAWITHPERLCHELILDAREAASPDQALARNYVAATGFEGGAVTLRCEVTGSIVRVRPKLVINATGAWIDEVNGKIGSPTSFIGGTKGSHLVLDHPELHRALDGQILYENPDARVCLVFPFHDKVIVGSTDLPIQFADEAVCDDEEVDYILDSARQILPGFTFERSQIVSRFCGVRPLPRSDAATTGQVSRDHSCRVLDPAGDRSFPIYSLIGGKWTTFRAFAEQVTDRSLEYLGKKRTRLTKEEFIGGGRDFPKETPHLEQWLRRVEASSGVPGDRLQVLLARYGTRAEGLATFLGYDKDSPLLSLPSFSRREISWISLNEDIVHLDDLLLRSTSLALLGKLNSASLHEIAEIVAETLGWDETRRDAAIAHSKKQLARNYGINFTEPTINAKPSHV